MKCVYYSVKDRQSIIDEYCIEKGYRIVEEQNHLDGNYLILGPPTEYHTLDAEDNWVIDDLAKWEDDMAATDIQMTRSIEDIWDVIGIENAPMYTQDIYNDKKSIREQKPGIELTK